VARRRDVERAVQLARDEGLEVRRISAASHDTTVLLLDRREADRDLRAWWGLALVGALGLLGVLNVQAWSGTREVRAATEAAQATLARLQAEADEVLRRREASGGLNAAVAADAALFTQDAQAIGRLADLTAALPAEAWATSLSLEPTQAYLAGSTSGDPAGLVETLGALDWVAQVDLAQPFLADPMAGATGFEFLLLAEGPVE
jgi:Tfp pilus assembly protein PilN